MNQTTQHGKKTPAKPLKHIKKTKVYAKKLWFRSANVREEALASDTRVRQVGLFYQLYRFVMGGFLLMSNFIIDRSKIDGASTDINWTEQAVFWSYPVVSLVLLGVFFIVRQNVRTQLLIGFLIDIVFLLLFTLYTITNDFQIMFLYMVVIASSYMLLSLSQAMTVALLTVSSIIYQQFFHNFFGETHRGGILTLNDSILLSIGLIGVGFLSWSISQRLSNAELSLESQMNEVQKLHAINQAVVKNMVNGVLVVDNDRDVVMINATAQKMLGLPINEHACDTPAQMVELARMLVKEHPTLINWYRTNDQERATYFIYQIPPKPHAERIATSNKLRVSSRPLSEHGQILIIEDIGREQSHAQKLKLASLGELSASIAHEIRNPLGAISQASQLLMEDASEDDVNYEFYEMIYEQTKRVNGIISDVLSLSRQEAPHQSAFDVRVWLEKFLAQHYPHEFITLECDTDTSVMILFDPNQLEQIMVNLVNNALRHTIHQFDESDVTLRLTKTEHGAFIDVLDNGEGVPEHQIPKLFNPFFTTSQKGTGLGLYLSQSFSEANNASIHYFREHNRSCFRLVASGDIISEKMRIPKMS